MIQRMKKYIMHTSREGYSLITVIIGVLFLAAIGTILLTIASNYLIAVNIDHNSSDNFYQTEGILEEVRTGLLEYAGDSGETAYKDVVENYTKTKENMRETFSKNYLSLLAGKLTGYSYNWDDSKLGTLQTCDLNLLKKLTKVPDAVTTKKGTDLEFVINKDLNKGYSLTLKNLMIDYTDETDYRSSIQADICMYVPDYKFEGDSTLEEVKDYIVISDDTLTITGNDNTTGATFRGNVYTGNKDKGIEVQSQNAAKFYSPTIISRGSLDILGGSHVNVQGEKDAGNLWLQNIRLKSQGVNDESTLQTTLDLNANAYIANDLDIEANNSVVTLSGKYYGYSYNEENTSSTSVARSDYSSAILINGMNTTLKAKNLDKLILAGRTFVSRNDKDGKAQISDIMMGESIAVKSNQLAYLLPTEYIVGDGATESHNPVMRDEIVTIDKEGLLNSEIGKYLDTNEPYTANYSNSGGYVFYYLKFKDEKSANEYFKNYYQGSQEEDGSSFSNKEQLDDKAKAYISTVDDTNMKFSSELFLIAGNVVHNYYATGGSSIQSDNYFDNAGKPKNELLTDGKKQGQDYVGYQLTLLASGSTGSMRLPENADALVAGRIIDFSKLGSTLNKLDEKTGARIYATPGDYVVDGSMKKGIIIAGGDVEVQSDFQGLILAKGKVTTTRSNLNLKSDMVLVGKLLEFAKSDKELRDLFYGLNGSNIQNPTDMSKCISYQNWQKNSY